MVNLKNRMRSETSWEVFINCQTVPSVIYFLLFEFFCIAITFFFFSQAELVHQKLYLYEFLALVFLLKQLNGTPAIPFSFFYSEIPQTYFSFSVSKKVQMKIVKGEARGFSLKRILFLKKKKIGIHAENPVYKTIHFFFLLDLVFGLLLPCLPTKEALVAASKTSLTP